MPDPTPPTWGQVIGRFALVQGDGPDLDPAPDLIAVTGTITLTPQVTSVRLVQPGSPVTLVTAPIVCQLGTDGILKGPDGQDGVRVMASRATGITPSAVQYKVSFNLLSAEGWPLDPQPAPFMIEVPEGGVVDLADVMPLPSAPAAIPVVSHEDRDEAAASAIAATAAKVAAESARDTAQTLVTAVPKWWSGTEAQYLALGTYEADRLYVVTA